VSKYEKLWEYLLNGLIWHQMRVGILFRLQIKTYDYRRKVMPSEANEAT